MPDARARTHTKTAAKPELAGVGRRVRELREAAGLTQTELALFTEALRLAERSELPCDLLRSRILGWRSRCYRRQRDWQAAREDVERALELAEGLNDRRTVAHHYFQASLI